MHTLNYENQLKNGYIKSHIFTNVSTIHKKLKLLHSNKEQKMKYSEHILRKDKYEILRFIMEGKITNNRSIEL